MITVGLLLLHSIDTAVIRCVFFADTVVFYSAFLFVTGAVGMIHMGTERPVLVSLF